MCFEAGMAYAFKIPIVVVENFETSIKTKWTREGDLYKEQYDVFPIPHVDHYVQLNLHTKEQNHDIITEWHDNTVKFLSDLLTTIAGGLFPSIRRIIERVTSIDPPEELKRKYPNYFINIITCSQCRNLIWYYQLFRRKYSNSWCPVCGKYLPQ